MNIFSSEHQDAKRGMLLSRLGPTALPRRQSMTLTLPEAVGGCRAVRPIRKRNQIRRLGTSYPRAGDAFLAWANDVAGKTDAVLRAALAHLWFVTIHPFDSSNRALLQRLSEDMERPPEVRSPTPSTLTARAS
jgi:hypothetical protein